MCKAVAYYQAEALRCIGETSKPVETDEEFTDDLIVRDDLPKDVFELIHDLAYDHEGRERFQYRTRAQTILTSNGL